ncbi:hypothetical protein H8F21_02325 [Pseudomonas sp. P66]|uniref:Uncharacterized protein n=1 Tax=Pseudomonas arcuscaelestis TaxID=2710591 RepID=A0ABS2BS09_9PSED|nr:hypothetical protein [Pseudomonas arcuscaelestis]MBM5456401.1 hypothetical protein [Pseudomonas arcuscaelestis]
MQSLAAYLLERTVNSEDEKISLIAETRKHLSNWLKEKGVADPAGSSGEFKSISSSETGHYKRETAVSNDEILEQIRLEESPRNNQIFFTNVAFATSKTRFFVYITLSATTKTSIISPISIDARCPSILRDILRNGTQWKVGNYLVPHGDRVQIKGDEKGLELAHYLKSSTRIFPVVVVSEYEGEQIWRGLGRKIAHDLAGLAQIYEVDDKASWAITDVIEKQNSCYSGAIRLYWPSNGSSSVEQFHGTLWTPYKLLSNDKDGEAEARFRRQIRRRVMSVSALTILPPKEIHEIQSASARKRLTDLEGKASSTDDLVELAQSYLDDADTLRSENTELQEKLSLAITRAENAEAIAENISRPLQEFDTEAPTENGDDEQEEQDLSPPVPGEIRYYKKVRNTPSHDLLTHVADCKHTSWQAAHKAEKAKKGVEKLEGVSNWDVIHHCGTCKGGGMWRVKW